MKEFEKLNRIGEGTYGIVCECGRFWGHAGPGRELGVNSVPFPAVGSDAFPRITLFHPAWPWTLTELGQLQLLWEPVLGPPHLHREGFLRDVPSNPALCQ